MREQKERFARTSSDKIDFNRLSCTINPIIRIDSFVFCIKFDISGNYIDSLFRSHFYIAKKFKESIVVPSAFFYALIVDHDLLKNGIKKERSFHRDIYMGNWRGGELYNTDPSR